MNVPLCKKAVKSASDSSTMRISVNLKSHFELVIEGLRILNKQHWSQHQLLQNLVFSDLISKSNDTLSLSVKFCSVFLKIAIFTAFLPTDGFSVY